MKAEPRATLWGRRGTFLSVLILAFGAAVSAATLALLFSSVKASLGVFPGWFNAFLLFLLLTRLAALYGIWRLKRLAVYLLAALELLEASVGLFVISASLTLTASLALLQRAAGVILVLLVLAAVWFLAIRPRWKEFS